MLRVTPCPSCEFFTNQIEALNQWVSPVLYWGVTTQPDYPIIQEDEKLWGRDSWRW